VDVGVDKENDDARAADGSAGGGGASSAWASNELENFQPMPPGYILMAHLYRCQSNPAVMCTTTAGWTERLKT